MSKFYSVSPLGKCDECNAKATEEIRGPFNAVYGHTCSRHATKRIAGLEKSHADTKEFPRT